MTALTEVEIKRQLAALERVAGPHLLAARVRAVAEARKSGHPDGLRGALLDLAAAAIGWADGVSTLTDRPDYQRAA